MKPSNICEKAFSGVGGSGDADSGTSMRVFGQFLTWLQENEKPVFLIATANDPLKLPAEFFRSGRFDAIFWCDLPGIEAREQIVKVLQAKHPRAAGADAAAVAEATEDYTGAEIEQAIIQALYTAFDAGKAELATEDVIEGLEHVNQVIIGWRTKLDRVRRWAESAALPADLERSSGEAAKTADIVPGLTNDGSELSEDDLLKVGSERQIEPEPDEAPEIN